MRLEVLAEFRELAHSLNYSTAAKNLHITQPNLSKHIAELEKELGFSLFSETRKTRLTSAGKTYLNAVCRILLIHEVAVKECKEITANNIRELKVLQPATHNEGTHILNNALRIYSNNAPARYIAFVHGRDKSILDNLFTKTADIATIIASSNSSDLLHEAEIRRISLVPLTTSPLLAWIHKQAPLAERQQLSWQDLSGASLTFAAHKSFDDIRFASTNMLLAAGVFPKCALTVRAAKNAEEFYTNVSDTEICLLTPGMASSSLITSCTDRITVPINEQTAHFTFFAAYRTDTDRNDIFEVLDIIKKSLVETDASIVE